MSQKLILDVIVPTTYDRNNYLRNKDKINARCRAYQESHKDELKEYKREYYQEHKEYLREKQRKWSINHKGIKHKYYMAGREKFLNMYGRTCSCCGESHVEFLTIEHINGRKNYGHGTSHIHKTSSTKCYSDATKEYRPDLYDVLCMNCNHAKGRLGYCPHHPRKRSKFK